MHVIVTENTKKENRNDNQRTPQSHIPVAKGAAIVANTGKADAGEKYFRRWDGDGMGEFSTFGRCEI